mgnify:CR=1 FL=1
MQQRHLNREQYFNELAQTAREHYIGYISITCRICPHSWGSELGRVCLRSAAGKAAICCPLPKWDAG